MCDQMVDEGHLATRASLTDPMTRDAAERDLRGWLSSLPAPAVIDEAQLLPELPVAVKDLVDQRGGAGHFVLTGSASIGRHGLGGSDPLAGRATRLCLWPMTQLELRRPRERILPNVVDVLFDGVFRPGTYPQSAPVAELKRRMVRGGFPLRALSGQVTSRRLNQQHVRADLEATLADAAVGHERLDVFLALRVLEALVGVPGGILNVSKLADELGVTRRTVDTYLGHLDRRFLLHRLANLGARPRTQGTGSARPKVHPVDTSVSAAILGKMGHRLEAGTELFGALFESHVVNELIAQSGWAKVGPQPGYWRDVAKRGEAEVDLVLVDSADRRLGIEVKSSEAVRASDAAGLLELGRSRGGLHRGFVVYRGERIVELAESVWAVPADFLSDPGAWAPPTAIGPRPGPDSKIEVTMTANEGAVPPEASLFVSYVHADDRSENGAIRALVERLADTYEFLFGTQLEVFFDGDIRWGELWRERLSQELERTTFLLAIVTPRFLGSEQCRNEVLEFSAAVRSVGQPKLILPLIWQMPAQLGEEGRGDPVVTSLTQAQWLDVVELRYEDPTSSTYRQLVEKIAGRLHETVVALEARRGDLPGQSAVVPASVDDPDQSLGALELMERAEDLVEQELGPQFDALATALVGVSGTLTSVGAPPSSTSARSVSAWAARAAETLDVPRGKLEQAVTSLRQTWAEFDDVVTGFLRQVDDLPSSHRPAELFDQLDELHRQLDEIVEQPELADLRLVLRGVAAMSRRLRPVAVCVESALDLVSQMRASARGWLQLRGSPPR